MPPIEREAPKRHHVERAMPVKSYAPTGASAISTTSPRRGGRGHPEVVDADLADYFGSIPHADLLKSVARRIADRRVLHLIKMWLECPWEETDVQGRRTGKTKPKHKRRAIRTE